MKISAEIVRRVAELSSLELSPDDVERMRRDLGAILDYVETLSDLDLDGVEPTTHVLEVATPLREDAVRGVLSPEQVVANAPESADGAIVVPKVLE